MSSKTEYVALDEDDEYQGAPKQNFDTQTGRKKKSNTPKTRMGKIRRSTTQNPSALDVSPDGGMSLASTDGITFTLKGAGSGNTYEPPGSNLSGGSKVNHLVDQKRREQEKARLASLVAAQERHSQMSVSLMSQVQSHHNELIQTEIKDRLSAPDLAQIFYLDDEKPIHKYYAFQCKSIQIEKSRTSNDDRSETAAGYYLDEPLEELPGRTVIFTNQRIIITDSSYAKDVQKDPSCRSRISFQEEQKKDQKGNSMNGTSNLFQDVLPLKLSSTLLSPFGNEGKVSENDFIHAGGPSVSAVPLLTSAPARFNSVTTCDWRYFRSFPLSEITDVRFDFITATRTQGKISYSGGEVPQGVSQHHEDEYDSDEEGCCSFLFGKVNTVRTMAVQPVDAPVVKTYGQPKTSVKDHVNSKRQVFLRIKDQGSISFDISSSHPTHTIAECMAALVPRSNEFEKLNKNWEIKLKKKNTELVKKDELLNETEERCRVLEEAVQQLANVIGNSEPGEEESGQMSLLATVLLGNKGKKKKEITVGQKKE